MHQPQIPLSLQHNRSLELCGDRCLNPSSLFVSSLRCYLYILRYSWSVCCSLSLQSHFWSALLWPHKHGFRIPRMETKKKKLQMHGRMLCRTSNSDQFPSYAVLLFSFLELPSIFSSFPPNEESLYQPTPLSDCLQLCVHFLPDHHH